MLGCLKCLLKAGRWLINRVGKKIDAQQSLHFQASSQRDGLDPARLVERISILLGDQSQYVRGTTSRGRAHQRFVGVHRRRLDIDNGLECHCKVG